MTTKRKPYEHTILYFRNRYEKLIQWSKEVNITDFVIKLYPTAIEFKAAWEHYASCCQLIRGERHASPMEYIKKDIMTHLEESLKQNETSREF